MSSPVSARNATSTCSDERPIVEAVPGNRYLVPSISHPASIGSDVSGKASKPKAISARVTGRVQGVGFRFNTAAKARELGLTGWVHNAADGSVEVWAQGDPEAIERFVRYLEVGPRAARVDGVRIAPGNSNPDFTSFNVRY